MHTYINMYIYFKTYIFFTKDRADSCEHCLTPFCRCRWCLWVCHVRVFVCVCVYVCVSVAPDNVLFARVSIIIILVGVYVYICIYSQTTRIMIQPTLANCAGSFAAGGVRGSAVCAYVRVCLCVCVCWFLCL